MVERAARKGVLELNLGPCVRYDLVVSSPAGTDNVGEMDIYTCTPAGSESKIFYKEVYDSDGNRRNSYFADSETIITLEQLGLHSMFHTQLAKRDRSRIQLQNRREVHG